jgi:hypothetical protein
MSRPSSATRYAAVQYHEPNVGVPDLSEGEMADSAAEVVDAPLLLLRIAQSRAETTRLVDWIRGAGALLFLPPHAPRAIHACALVIALLQTAKP